ncbi:MAG: hypothetical protein HDR21_00145 [Lachnospiraceae bacterium]|nr:hypothetical protein [Lachnospiraceae bacterium]
MEQEAAWQTQTSDTEYIPEEMMEAAGLKGETLAVAQMRFELYELENEVAAGSADLAGMRKKWDGIKRSLRFSLIMLTVFFLLRMLMEIQLRELVIIYLNLTEADASADMAIKIVNAMIYFFRELFYAADWVFLTRSIYKGYAFFCNYDSEASRRWCVWQNKKNLSMEIEQQALRLIKLEERLRRLKQVRTMYRERMQEEWLEENLPERVVMERELAEEK